MLTSCQACTHSFFDELRNPLTAFPEGLVEDMFTFTEEELSMAPQLRAVLIPPHMAPSSAEESSASAAPALSAPSAEGNQPTPLETALNVVQSSA